MQHENSLAGNCVMDKRELRAMLDSRRGLVAKRESHRREKIEQRPEKKVHGEHQPKYVYSKEDRRILPIPSGPVGPSHYSQEEREVAAEKVRLRALLRSVRHPIPSHKRTKYWIKLN